GCVWLLPSRDAHRDHVHQTADPDRRSGIRPGPVRSRIRTQSHAAVPRLWGVPGRVPSPRLRHGAVPGVRGSGDLVRVPVRRGPDHPAWTNPEHMSAGHDRRDWTMIAPDDAAVIAHGHAAVIAHGHAAALAHVTSSRSMHVTSPTLLSYPLRILGS